MAATLEKQRHRAARGRAKSDMKVTRNAATGVVNVRVDSDTRALIDAASGFMQLTRTDFMLTCARARAQEILLSKAFFSLSGSDWDAFQSALDSPPEPNAALRKLMARTPQWQE